MKRLGAVVVTYNSARCVGRCLDGLLAAGVEAVVVDNGSGDATVEEVRRRPAARLIANTENRGFAAGVNQGARALEGDLLLIVNPDVFLETPLDALEAACMEAGVGAAAGRLVDESGVTQAGFTFRRLPGAATLVLETLGINRLWPGNPVNRRYRCLDADYSRAGDVEQPAGAFLMVRREVFNALGGFDEQFFPCWFEDVDFCQRLGRAGWRIRYEPEVVAAHIGGHSVSRAPREARRLAWNLNLMRYARKHSSAAGAWAVRVAVAAAAAGRALPECIAGRSLAPLGAYARVIRAALGEL